MTSKLRPAEEVADDCWGEAEFCNIAEAAAVIEADREAVRAEVVREIVAWLRDQWQGRLQSPVFMADQIEAKFGGRDV